MRPILSGPEKNRVWPNRQKLNCLDMGACSIAFFASSQSLNRNVPNPSSWSIGFLTWVLRIPMYWIYKIINQHRVMIIYIYNIIQYHQ